MRYINFTIPGQPNILVRLVEQPDGSILATLTVEGGARLDLRGLFFDVRDASLLSSLSITGSDVVETRFADEGVIDLGNGVNMRGAGREPFDVGIEFGTAGNGRGVVTSTSFVISSSSGGLTLDDLALVDFGVRTTGGPGSGKHVITTPAAPDAIDDSATANEDETTIFHVLSNDTDEDGTSDFRIVSVSDPEHGTATISADGKYIIYVSDPNYSGPDSFTYEMSDGNGGGDTAGATVGVVAVADRPTLSLSTAAGANVNQILITVTANVTDTDGSEYIDRFEFAGLPPGAQIVGEGDLVYDPTSTGQMLSQTFVVQLAPNSDFDFDLAVTAVAREHSNGSEASETQSLDIVIDANSNSFGLEFQAIDQSIWSSGDAFIIEDDRFIGFEFDPGEISTGGFVFGAADLYLRTGFDSHLTFNGGEVDASIPYDIDVDTTYNHVTDVLLIQSSAVLQSGETFFSTQGPSGSYILDFIFNWAISARLGLDFAVDDVTLLGFSEGSNHTINLLNVDSDDLSVTFEFPYGLSIDLAWPNVDTTSLISATNVFASSGASNNFFQLNLDVDQALADIFLGGANPFDFGIDVGVAWGSVELLDVDLSGGINFLQSFLMSVGNLTGTLLFENGATQAWNFSDIVLTNASSYDQDGDGIIEFALQLNPSVTLTNNTDLGFNFGYLIELLQASGSYDIGVDSGGWSVGPVWSTGGTIPLGSIDLYDTTFALGIGSQTVFFNGNETLVA